MPGPVHNSVAPGVVEDPLNNIEVTAQVSFGGLVFTVMFGAELSPQYLNSFSSGTSIRGCNSECINTSCADCWIRSIGIDNYPGPAQLKYYARGDRAAAQYNRSLGTSKFSVLPDQPRLYQAISFVQQW